MANLAKLNAVLNLVFETDFPAGISRREFPFRTGTGVPDPAGRKLLETVLTAATELGARLDFGRNCRPDACV